MTITFKVTAPLGVYIAGLGSREQGETFVVSEERAVQFHLETVQGLERVDPPTPARKSKPKAPDAPEAPLASDKKEA